MDILNIISWIKGKRQVTTIDPTKSVIPVGIKDSHRDDGYQSYIITVDDLLAGTSGPIATLGSSLYSTNPASSIISNNGVNAFGLGAGSINASDSNFFGRYAGFGSGVTTQSNFFGINAGANAINSNDSNFLGGYAGQGATVCYRSNFFGNIAGEAADLAYQSNFIGYAAGDHASNSYQSNFIGYAAGNYAPNANNANFIGYLAGYQASNAYNSNFIGKEAGMSSTSNNVNAFGYRAHKGGTLSGQTVFSNSSLPSYLNRSAATTAITVPNGAVAGSTYLYYNQTTFAIEAVRL